MTSARVPETALTDAQQRELEIAHRQLNEAVAGYERFLGRELSPGEPVPTFDANEISAAQEAIDVAEQELWKLRERYLGWFRPSWAPSASQESDWFSAEDAIYDEVGTAVGE